MRIVVLGIASLLLGACGASNSQLTTRASFDLGCPAEQIEVVPIDAQTQGARGCGKQAAYVELCKRPNDLVDKQCTWLKNDATSAQH